MAEQLRLLKQRVIDPDVEWQDINDLRTSYYNEAESRDTTRKGSKLLYEYIDAGWVHPPICDATRGQRASIAYDDYAGCYTSEMTLDADESILKDPTALLKAHGYDPNRFHLVSSKSSLWTVGGRQEISSKIVVRPIENDEPRLEDLEEWFKNLSQTYTPPVTTHEYTPGADELLVIPLSDLHFGMLATSLRTGNTYDMDIARKIVTHTINNLLGQLSGHKFKKILLTIGGDMLNADNMSGTTVKGTPQDQCADYFTICHALYDMMVMLVEDLLCKAPVDILYIPANHDMTTSFQLAQYLRAWFRANRNVYVDASPLPRKYYIYGKTLLVFAHDGDVKRLPTLIADEARDVWSDVAFTDVFLQHLHSEKVLLEENHMRIQRLPTLCAKSAWTVDQGYNAARQHKSFIYDVQGLRQVIYTAL